VQESDQAREVVFSSSKGETVIGAVLGTGSVGVVLAHQVQSDLCEWLPYAKTLRDMGRRVLIFDFGLDRSGDVAGAAKELRAEGVAKLVLVGASIGGTASLVAASVISPPVDGVASLSGPAAYSVMDGMAAAQLLRIPVLFMAAQNDQERPYDFPRDARAMYAACPSSHKQLLIVPGNDHGSEMLTGNAGDQARRALEAFIAKATS
jgi:dienelactone hydrolase